MFTIGNEELEKALPIGDFILCKHCGHRHIIEHADGSKGTPKLLSFYKCGSKSYLAGVTGKAIA